jgi:hypothetical protein
MKMSRRFSSSFMGGNKDIQNIVPSKLEFKVEKEYKIKERSRRASKEVAGELVFQSNRREKGFKKHKIIRRLAIE